MRSSAMSGDPTSSAKNKQAATVLSDSPWSSLTTRKMKCDVQSAMQFKFSWSHQKIYPSQLIGEFKSPPVRKGFSNLKKGY